MKQSNYEELEKSKEDLIREINSLKEEIRSKDLRLKEYETESISNKFIQIFIYYQKFIRTFNLKHPKAFNIFLFMCENSDKNNEIFISQKTLSQIFNISERKIRDKIKTLSDHKLIKKVKNGRNVSYIINSSICWKNSAEQKIKFSKFHEQPVYLDLEVNEKPYKTKIEKGVK
jgi:hypothetical protein